MLSIFVGHGHNGSSQFNTSAGKKREQGTKWQWRFGVSDQVMFKTYNSLIKKGRDEEFVGLCLSELNQHLN